MMFQNMRKTVGKCKIVQQHRKFTGILEVPIDFKIAYAILKKKVSFFEEKSGGDYILENSKEFSRKCTIL